MSPDLYLWLKAFHVAAALTFTGGVLGVAMMLAALGGEAALSPAQVRTVQTIRRWERMVTTPAMLAVWALGLTLALSGAWFSSFWLPAKLLLVVILSGLHGLQSGRLRRLAGTGERSAPLHLALPLIVTTTAMIAVLVVIKPF